MAKITLTKAEWAAVKAELELPYRELKFQIDDHVVTAQSVVSNRRIQIDIYVDGWVRGAWFTGSNRPDFMPRLYPTHEKFLYSKKIRDDAKKFYGVKAWKVKCADYEKKFSWQTLSFNSVAAMKKTWENNNDSIQLIKDL